MPPNVHQLIKIKYIKWNVSHKEEWNIDILLKWDKAQKSYAKWQESVTKKHIFYHLCKISKIGKFLGSEIRSVVARGCWKGKMESDSYWVWSLFLKWYKFSGIREWWFLYNFANTLKAIRFYTLNRWILLLLFITIIIC